MSAEDGSTVQPPASARDHHLFGPGPKRILALDGGGVRGVISIAFLERIEALLEQRAGRPVRLCDYFDLIGGTSTGAIIAAGLALGMTAADIKELYFGMSAHIFRRSPWRVAGFQSKFDAGKLRAELANVLGNRTIASTDLCTGLAVVMKRADTGSPWVVSNNPRAKFWETPQDGSYIGNKDYLLMSLVRASTAAPHFFAPESIDIAEGGVKGLFLDGAVSPHNNPSLQLLMLATMEGYRLGWQLGSEQLLLVSVGAGSYRNRISQTTMPSAMLAVQALSGLIGDNQSLVLTLLYWLSGQTAPWPLNGEIGDLSHDPPPGGTSLLRFQRYDVHLESEWLRVHTGSSLTEEQLRQVHRIDDPGTIRKLYDLASLAADRFVKPEDFPPAFDLSSASLSPQS